MAKHLDLEEQEQLDQIKHFWAQYGNLISWVLIVVFGSLAAWNGWNYWQRSQATQASAMFEAVERATLANDADKVERAFTELKDGYGGTVYAAQGALLAGKVLSDAGKTDAARAALEWVAENGADDALQAVAALRLAGMDIEKQAYDQAMKRLDGAMPEAFAGLVADRKGDVLLAQGKGDAAKDQYLVAWKAMGDRVEYRQLVEVKLASLGVEASTLSAGAEVAR
ncbi:tetratricopeptide repeat protein [Hydrogenophaga sp. PAMC20947]|uniref:YfgM family protein n=1 Tax=Hydrogenophaga sp. PAMC20947 TaxID=2565558 RepID=UPI00109DE15C|nr:tetratricopeptide repeat protein [Hydrogenophaga sp. PAMC20947]QCB45256.1 tetratricopeptide repeat protein [Hydrogenophaga sp. PAMC20947]